MQSLESAPALLNAAVGWSSLALGAASGALLGLGFHRADFLGGYDSYRRRLIRLGHIAFFGLGFVNLFFALQAPQMRLAPHELQSASWALIIGNATMPLACALTAWRAALKPVFAVPVATVLYGTISAAIGLWRAA